MKIGDLVAVIDDNLKGKITSIKEKKVLIEDEHGFSYEFETKEVILQDAEMYDHINTIQKADNSKNISKKHNKRPFILDLHFGNLVKNQTRYNASERLFIQKEKLVETIEYCRKNNLKKLEIIHGIGEGVLQKMVLDVLESQSHLEFHDKEILHNQSGTVLVYFR